MTNSLRFPKMRREKVCRRRHFSLCLPRTALDVRFPDELGECPTKGHTWVFGRSLSNTDPAHGVRLASRDR